MQSRQAIWWALIVLVVAAGFAGRAWQTGESLWVDELHTAWCATGPLAEVAPRAAIGNQSPLFFWLEWLAVRALGPSEFSLRAASVLAGSLWPLALFAFAWRYTDAPIAGLVAATLATIDPLSIFFATEARPYALVQFAAVLHVWAFLQLLERPTLCLRLAFIGGAGLLFYLHFTAILLIPAELVAWGVLVAIRSRESAYRLPKLAIDCAAIGALVLPARLQMAEIFERRGNWATFIEQQPLSKIFEMLPWAAASLVVLAALIYEWLPKGQAATPTSADQPPETANDNFPSRRRDLAIVALSWLLTPLLLAWLATALDVSRILFPRYLAASAPAALLLVGLAVSFIPRAWAQGLVAAAIIGWAFSTSGISDAWRAEQRLIPFRREDWRSAVAWLNERLAANELPVLVASGLIEADALQHDHPPLLEDYCLLPVTGLYKANARRERLEPLTFQEPARLRPEARSLLAQHGGAWIIARGRQAESFKSPPAPLRLEESREFGNVFVGRVRSNPRPGSALAD